MPLAPGTTEPSSHVVRKILFPQTIGEECPFPGSGVFHLMFLVPFHSVGRFFSAETPLLSGPRHVGQFEVFADRYATPRQTRIERSRRINLRFMVCSPALKVRVAAHSSINCPLREWMYQGTLNVTAKGGGERECRMSRPRALPGGSPGARLGPLQGSGSLVPLLS